jgi:hypothetical protein
VPLPTHGAPGRLLSGARPAAHALQEEDCIGILPSSDKISQLKPLGDRVLIKCAKAASSSAGGVLLANESADKPTFGEVRATRPPSGACAAALVVSARVCASLALLGGRRAAGIVGSGRAARCTCCTPTPARLRGACTTPPNRRHGPQPGRANWPVDHPPLAGPP